MTLVLGVTFPYPWNYSFDDPALDKFLEYVASCPDYLTCSHGHYTAERAIIIKGLSFDLHDPIRELKTLLASPKIGELEQIIKRYVLDGPIRLLKLDNLSLDTYDGSYIHTRDPIKTLYDALDIIV